MFEVASCALERCSRCRFAQVNEEPSHETLQELYSGDYFDKGKYGDPENQKRENRRRLEFLEKIGLRQGSKILDAGCATGDFLTAATELDRWGIDISPEAVAQAQEANPDIATQISACRAEELPFEDASFDAVVLWDVIEHLWDPRTTCEHLTRLIRPGGFLVLSTPDIGALTARLMGTRWAFMTPPEHLGFFSTPSFRWLLERELGLTTISSFLAGKWVNAGFLSYKLRRVLSGPCPEFFR